MGSHPGAEPETDREGQAKAYGVQVIVNAIQINRCVVWPGHSEFFGGEVILSEEIVQLELAGVPGGTHGAFFFCQFGQVVHVDRAVFVGALIGRTDAVLFPLEKGVATQCGHQ